MRAPGQALQRIKRAWHTGSFLLKRKRAAAHDPHLLEGGNQGDLCGGWRSVGGSDTCGVRLFSSVGTADTTATNSTISRDKLASTRPPSALFPWRHEGMDNLIPRVTAGTPESSTLLPLFAPEELMAKVFMDQSWWNALVSKQWKHDLEEGMCYAFAQSVAGIVSNVYHVPLQEVLSSSSQQSSLSNSSPDVSFVYNDNQNESSSSSSVNDSSSQADDNKEDKSNPSQYCPEIEHMMTPALRRLFQSAHDNGTNQLRIRLQVTPKRAYFHRLHGIPFVSRQQVDDRPSLLHNVFINAATGKFQADVTTLYNFLSDNAAEQSLKSGNGTMETTLAAEALIVCDEIFCVWDAETGQVLQGKETTSPTEVGHVVIFERSCQTTPQGDHFPYLPQITHLSNWQIVDIDDLLGPKKWFHVTVSDNDNDKNNNNNNA